MDTHKEIISHHFGKDGAPKSENKLSAGGLGYGGVSSARPQKYSAGGGHGGGGHHGGGGGGHHGGGGRGWRGRGGYGYPVYGGYYGYPYYWDYPYAETVLLTDAPAAAAKKPDEEAKKAIPAAPANAVQKSDNKSAISNMNYLLGGAAGGVAGYFIATNKGNSGIGGAAIGAVIVIASMVTIDHFSKK